ncbi:putative 2OG-Fe dioxygenase-domain-containing protein [Seiridium cardinale]
MIPILVGLEASQSDISKLSSVSNALEDDPILLFRKTKNDCFRLDFAADSIRRFEFQPFVLSEGEGLKRHDTGQFRHFKEIRNDLQHNTVLQALLVFKALITNCLDLGCLIDGIQKSWSLHYPGSNQSNIPNSPQTLSSFDPCDAYIQIEDGAGLENIFAIWPDVRFTMIPKPWGSNGIDEAYWEFRNDQELYLHGAGYPGLAQRVTIPISGPDALERRRKRNNLDDTHNPSLARFQSALKYTHQYLDNQGLGCTSVGLVLSHIDMFLPQDAVTMIRLLLGPSSTSDGDTSSYCTRPDIRQTILHLLTATPTLTT